MAENRNPRDLVSRDKTARPVYVPPSALPDPTPEPGYVYRWIMTHLLGEANPTNVSRKMREGWVPVKAEDHPELLLDLGLEGSAPKTGLVLFGGLMLSKNLEENVVKRSNYYESMADQQMKSVDNNFLKQSDARMPLFSDRRAEVTFGRGNGK